MLLFEYDLDFGFYKFALQDGLTAIHRAILAKKHAIFNFLLRESANPFIRDKVSGKYTICLIFLICALG